MSTKLGKLVSSDTKVYRYYGGYDKGVCLGISNNGVNINDVDSHSNFIGINKQDLDILNKLWKEYCETID